LWLILQNAIAFLLYTYRMRMLFYPITYVRYAYVILEGGVWSHHVFEHLTVM